jgi:hypothetical protein
MDARERDEQPTGANGDPILDESAFIKKAERRSVRRTLFVAVAVVLSTLVILGVGRWAWDIAIQQRAQRIAEFYVPLARLMKPNNDVDQGLVIRDFPGATMQLIASRRIGNAVVPAGVINVRFYPWGSATIEDTRHFGDITDGRFLIQPDATPELVFLEPPVGGGDATEVWGAAVEDEPFLSTAANSRRTSLARLQAAPASSTVEVAVSFDDAMTLEQLETRIGDDLQLAWGALRTGNAYSATDEDGQTTEAGSSWSFHFPGSSGVIGVPFAAFAVADSTFAEQESWGLETLRVAERMPWFERRSLIRSREYIEKNGTEYFGAVVVGSPEAALKLATSADVSMVSLGAVVMPYQ